MKKLLPILLVFLLLLCTACGEKDPITPPDDSLMMKSTFDIAEGKVTEKVLHSVSPDFKNYYAYTLKDGQESLQEGNGGAHGKLTFAQMQKAMDCIAAYSSDPGFAFSGPYDDCEYRPETVWYAVADEAPQAVTGFFVYSLSENSIKPLEGKYTGARTGGVFTLNNIDYVGNIIDGSNQGKWCYFFIDQ